MVSTDVDLCNHALSYLGESRIAALTEDNERARVCSLLYPQTRDELLAMYQWPFAVGRASLSAVDEENLTMYAYKYALPSDYLKLLDLVDADTYQVISGSRQEIGYYEEPDQYDNAYDKVGVRYQIEGNRLLCNMSPCIIRYVKQIENPGLFPELFVSVIIPSLAAKLAPRLSQNFELGMQMVAISQNAMVQAKAELNKDALTRPPAMRFMTEMN